ncbi:unnamed protein product [Vitrella brassicaformis CCMP3155]|uniref:Uncharacterized protein n=1 Tax=Vitrella brassicaformis (strain CCMP3155) TaxID=1169540 RepID=A0A0G4EFG1_VITBC|nr:unnamed protein product [Vitrella brassicaformis CCMP3155]|eukprot:CEL94241.1 unnamed protein product [Vitrella brassicaformis CCMP3155]
MMGSVSALGTSTTGKSGVPEGEEKKYALKASITWPMALASIPCIALLSIPVGGCPLSSCDHFPTDIAGLPGSMHFS